MTNYSANLEEQRKKDAAAAKAKKLKMWDTHHKHTILCAYDPDARFTDGKGYFMFDSTEHPLGSVPGPDTWDTNQRDVIYGEEVLQPRYSVFSRREIPHEHSSSMHFGWRSNVRSSTNPTHKT